MCIGDFNFVLNKDEILGGRKGCSSTNNYLNELMFEFGAIDLGYAGSKYTWAKGIWGKASIKRKLDRGNRGIANISWRLAYLRASITYLGAISSNHTRKLLKTNLQTSFAHCPFRFEATWLRDERCYSVIETVWKEHVKGLKFIKLYKK